MRLPGAAAEAGISHGNCVGGAELGVPAEKRMGGASEHASNTTTDIKKQSRLRMSVTLSDPTWLDGRHVDDPGMQPLHPLVAKPPHAVEA